MRLLQRLVAGCLLAGLALPATADERWQALRGAEARLEWPAPGLMPKAEKAEGMIVPLGYRIERYFWKAQESGGAFALVALRDFTETDHYISGRLDVAKSAALLLKGLETPAITVLDTEDRKLPTGFGLGIARRLSLGVRECLGLALYGAASGEPAPQKGVPLSEGSLRVDALYCAKAGKPLVIEDLPALAKGLVAVTPGDGAPEQRKD